MIRPPLTRDGRNLDREVADLRGEGAVIEVGSPGATWPIAAEGDPGAVVADTYYDLPVVKMPAWKAYIPTYFYAGGLAGAAATLAAAGELAGVERLARRLHGIAVAGEAVGAVCLIADLGRPARFHYMMRVFRPTSPMNLGTWILAAASASSGLAWLGGVRGRRTTALSVVSAGAGAMLATYTGVLIGNTAIPLWSEARRRLPVWFAASAAASLASLLELFGGGPRVYCIAAKTAEIAGARAVERVAQAAGVARPLREGRSGRMWRGARWLGAASLAATVLRRPGLAGVLGTAAAVLARFAILEAGRTSAADPRATFELQRARSRDASA